MLHSSTCEFKAAVLNWRVRDEILGVRTTLEDCRPLRKTLLNSGRVVKMIFLLQGFGVQTN